VFTKSIPVCSCSSKSGGPSAVFTSVSPVQENNNRQAAPKSSETVAFIIKKERPFFNDLSLR
jgi:hypothetical protein